MWMLLALAGILVFLLAYASEASATGLAAWDDRVAAWAPDAPAWAIDASLAFQFIGRPIYLTVIASGAAIVYASRSQPVRALVLVFASFSGGGIVAFLKSAIARARPEVALRDLEDFSFPSGHATFGMLSALLVVWLVLPVLQTRSGQAIAWGLALVFAGLMAASRVVLAVHYVSDVIAGLGLGMAVAGFTIAFGEQARTRPGGRSATPP